MTSKPWRDIRARKFSPEKQKQIDRFVEDELCCRAVARTHTSALGPFLSAVEDAKNLHIFGPHAIGEYARRARDDKLTGIWCPARAPGRGVVSQELCSVADPLRYIGGCGGVVAGDIGPDGLEVLDRFVKPPDSHSGGLRSSAMPQLASQASTSSWLTKRASRRLALLSASRIALVCHALRAT